MDKFDRSLARIARNIMSAADSIDSVEGKLLLYLVAGEIGAEAMRPDEDPSVNKYPVSDYSPVSDFMRRVAAKEGGE